MFRTLSLALFLFLALASASQQVTGVWKGKIDRKKVELKIVQKGDSLTGTSYYHESASNYRRYSIKGYFDPYTNSVVWWDDQLISSRGSAPGKIPQLSVADFNCPGGGQMFLDGKARPKDEENKTGSGVDLEKTNTSTFRDEWDFVIDNYTIGANHPEIIDSVSLIAFNPVPQPQPMINRNELPVKPRPASSMVTIPAPPQQTIEPPKTIEEKFTIRKKTFTTEIKLETDSIELRFFDNVQVDGDSITLFLNDELIFTHIRLTEKAFVFKLATEDLKDVNELTMVAENLGDIPPNTAYMVAIVGDKRYDVNLSSTEETSGMIRLIKPTKQTPSLIQ